VWQKHPMSKTVFFVPKREPQFLNHSDPTHDFASTLTKKSVVPPTETDPISTSMSVKQTTPSNHESLNDKKASPTQRVATATNECDVCLAGRIVSTNNKANILFSIAKQKPQKQFQWHATNQSLFAVQCGFLGSEDVWGCSTLMGDPMERQTAKLLIWRKLMDLFTMLFVSKEGKN